MYVKELIIKNFRNYEHLNMKFSPNINFIIGENGVGKTNIIVITIYVVKRKEERII